MENNHIKVDFSKVILFTAIKVALMCLVFFALNNWPNIKKSFAGDIPPLKSWLAEGFTLSNLILICLLSVVFFFNSYKQHKAMIEERLNR